MTYQHDITRSAIVQASKFARLCAAQVPCYCGRSGITCAGCELRDHVSRFAAELQEFEFEVADRTPVFPPDPTSGWHSERRKYATDAIHLLTKAVNHVGEDRCPKLVRYAFRAACAWEAAQELCR